MEYYKVGTIVNTQGIHGELRVIATTDFSAKRFQPGTHLFIFSNKEAEPKEVVVKTHRQHKQFEILCFNDLEDINLVEKYKQADLKILASQQDKLPEGEYYYRQIIGLNVVTQSGEKIGIVKEIMTPGANDVWVVQRPNKKELLLPAIADVVKDVQLDKKQVIVEMMDGLE
ncbi:ribosome maturation factor RimM [Ligilactobacillus sp. WILCCON 0076]|uniref:Ribosome maturation factor RimM n=1 Tax=Ligilactobacillus ubinensis TaxID=2876789 RepID=A0A9X2JLJ4_9LACO|nr:ribosome maturation factor RimM [Ligilactobacillus ubinensis]MCP0886979.1 ribosome maturation factor RimM [Ligilactobacillus ubinensis]